MSSKAAGVFWIGLILIFINFWLSGQSTTLWNVLVTGSGNPGAMSKKQQQQSVQRARNAGASQGSFWGQFLGGLWGQGG